MREGIDFRNVNKVITLKKLFLPAVTSVNYTNLG